MFNPSMISYPSFMLVLNRTERLVSLVPLYAFSVCSHTMDPLPGKSEDN